ncbi:MAG: AAA family ATPase [Lachnospiraceae bacterium]|nr:AAA family ATPase [Lachnospiraceae bacterium]
MRKIAIGYDDFAKLRKNNCFYVDKTWFIKEWWENFDFATLITRPRRFGKTMTISMLEHFFSIEYAGSGALFEGLFIWEEEKYQKLQGTYPVISVSFANVKENTYDLAREKICAIIANLYVKHSYLLKSDKLLETEKQEFEQLVQKKGKMSDAVMTMAIHRLCDYMKRYYGKDVILLLDEYDTPMQEAYVYGFWKELVAFTRSMFNSMFKTNPYLERGIMTGITRVSKESIFSDLNNLEVVTTTSNKYETSFGFTEEEVFAALEEAELSDKREEVKRWYDGFTFGSYTDIYNPWSILNYLDKKSLRTYWANTSSNNLVGKVIREGNSKIKMTLEELIQGKTMITNLDEQIVFNQLDTNQDAIWSLLLASGYLKVVKSEFNVKSRRYLYELKLTNLEVQIMFEDMIEGWFRESKGAYNDFIKAFLQGDLEEMNAYMNEVVLATFSYFDTGAGISERRKPESFYHGFVLGIMIELKDSYYITSNRESGYGRYDVMLEPMEPEKPAFVLEFKVQNKEAEATLKDTVAVALKQIEDKKYDTELNARGIPSERIRHYGFAFYGKEVFIGTDK